MEKQIALNLKYEGTRSNTSFKKELLVNRPSKYARKTKIKDKILAREKPTKFDIND